MKYYTINRRKRSYGWTWILSEYSLPDHAGNFQRVKVVADFGNTKRKENYQAAKLCRNYLQGLANEQA